MIDKIRSFIAGVLVASIGSAVLPADAASPAGAASKAVGPSNLVDRPPRPLFVQISLSKLPPSSREMAEQLEIMPLLNEIYEVNGKLSDAGKTLLRQKILETLLEAYFDAVSIQAEAEREQMRLEGLREFLVNKRDRGVEWNNATNFIASGTLNTVGSVLGFSPKMPPFPGNLNQMLSGVVSTGMSTYSLKQNAGGKTAGSGNPTVLAELFGRPTNHETTYPESVWRFLHGQVPADSPELAKLDAPPGTTRVQLLEKLWIKRRYLPPPGSPREALKIDLVCGVARPGKLMSLDDLSDQINMIDDVETAVGLMTHHIRDLLRMIDSDVILTGN